MFKKFKFLFMSFSFSILCFNAYGFDLKPRSNLTALLEQLELVEGIQWIRLFYAYPRSFPKGLIELMSRPESNVEEKEDQRERTKPKQKLNT